MYRSLCWLGYCFSTRLSPLLLYYVKYMIMYVIWPSWKSWKGASMCPFAGVLESWWREEGNCFEEVKLAGSGMQLLSLRFRSQWKVSSEFYQMPNPYYGLFKKTYVQFCFVSGSTHSSFAHRYLCHLSSVSLAHTSTLFACSFVCLFVSPLYSWHYKMLQDHVVYSVP